MKLALQKKISLAIVLLFVLAACTPIAFDGEEFAPRQGAKAPLFNLISLEGQNVLLEDFRGQLVLMSFWATWCAPCRFEMPAMQDRYENTDLVVLGINFDESEEAVRAFVDELALTFPILMDPGASIQQLYKVRGYPTSFMIDEEGVIQIVHIGFLDEAQLDGYLLELGISY